MPIDLRFRASQDYATRNGFVGAVPTFYVANLPSNIVYGALLIRSQAADWRDVPASALGGPLPADFATWVMAINAYAKRWGYACGFPTFLQTVANNDYAYGAMLFKKGTVQVQEPSADQLANQVIPVVPWFEAVQRFAAGQNQPGGYPTFETVTQRIIGTRGGVSGTVQTFPTVILPNSAAEWRDLPASVLNNPGLANLLNMLRLCSSTRLHSRASSERSRPFSKRNLADFDAALCSLNRAAQNGRTSMWMN
jgi:hypothetical protein